MKEWKPTPKVVPASDACAYCGSKTIRCNGQAVETDGGKTRTKAFMRCDDCGRGWVEAGKLVNR